ncbi:MAG: hypothetical protein E7387_02025 [Ruminococcaceae bacterium]|nr:hypothetical protein [Oscillospiraceae bacterium]
MTFRDLIGQEQVKQLLIESIQTERIGHAYMFCGPEGIGRRTMAECFAEAISCSSQSAEPCGICSACTLNKSGTNPDIIHIRRQDGKASVGVEDIRLVQDEISTAPQFGKYKVIIFENAEKMTVQAQNALLKTLEEPPSYIVMILISSNNSQMLDTVKSRAVKVDFKRYSDSEITEAYTKQNSEGIDSRLLCEYADGIIGRALSVTSFSEYEEICNKIANALIALSKGGGRELCCFENLLAEYAEKKEFFFFTLYSILRDISVFASYGRKVALQNVQIASKIYSLSESIGYHKAVKCLDLVNKSWRMVGQNVNYKLMAEALAIRIQEVFHG